MSKTVKLYFISFIYIWPPRRNIASLAAEIPNVFSLLSLFHTAVRVFQVVKQMITSSVKASKEWKINRHGASPLGHAQTNKRSHWCLRTCNDGHNNLKSLTIVSHWQGPAVQCNLKTITKILIMKNGKL